MALSAFPEFVLIFIVKPKFGTENLTLLFLFSISDEPAIPGIASYVAFDVMMLMFGVNVAWE